MRLAFGLIISEEFIGIHVLSIMMFIANCNVEYDSTKLLSKSSMLKACIHYTQVPETSFDLLFLKQITQLLSIGVPETSSRNFYSVCRP